MLKKYVNMNIVGKKKKKKDKGVSLNVPVTNLLYG